MIKSRGGGGGEGSPQNIQAVTQSYNQKITFNSIEYFTEKKSQQRDSLCSLLREHGNVLFFFLFGGASVFVLHLGHIFAALTIAYEFKHLKDHLHLQKSNVTCF